MLGSALVLSEPSFILQPFVESGLKMFPRCKYPSLDSSSPHFPAAFSPSEFLFSCSVFGNRSHFHSSPWKPHAVLIKRSSKTLLTVFHWSRHTSSVPVGPPARPPRVLSDTPPWRSSAGVYVSTTGYLATWDQATSRNKCVLFKKLQCNISGRSLFTCSWMYCSEQWRAGCTQHAVHLAVPF